MSARGGTETVVRVLGAFLGEQRTWSQRELAQRLGLTVQGLRKRLKEMQESGIPFVREHDPPEVYWSLPRGWVPGALSFEADEVVELMRALARSPRTKARERLLKRVRDALPTEAAPIDPATIDAPTVDDEATLRLMEDAIRLRVAVEGRYRKGRGAVDEWRTVSPQRLDVRERPRVAAVCHRKGALRWFRLDGFSAARLDRATAWRAVGAAELRAFFDESLGGFRDGERRRESFVVAEREATWVQRNLPGAARCEEVEGGVRFEFDTAGVQRLARFVAGLGDALVAVETPGLREGVRAIAQAALAAVEVKGEDGDGATK